ncbi:hypothetical protein [Streptomyces sp. NPDC052721]|uniref:hypothetical protein n=1 Tax=Streptomyces sp. NPDC052721 TaxID=3154955 RepID=UPI00343AB3CE
MSSYEDPRSHLSALAPSTLRALPESGARDILIIGGEEDEQRRSSRRRSPGHESVSAAP